MSWGGGRGPDAMAPSASPLYLRWTWRENETHNNDLYKNYFTLPLQLLHQFNILLFMHNYVYHRNKLPVVFSTYFEENKVNS